MFSLGIKRYNNLDPSKGGIGIRLKIANPILATTTTASHTDITLRNGN
jgi:hypothetical protein